MTDAAPTFCLPWAELSWNSHEVPCSTHYDDHYYHPIDPLAEIEHVFLVPNRLRERFRALKPRQVFCVAETGFGTGLNFLHLCALWQREVVPRFDPNQLPCLVFMSFEKCPLTPSQLARAHQPFLGPGRQPLTEWAHRLQDAYPHRVPGWHQCDWLEQGVSLQVFWGDVLAGLKELEADVDAWFLDGFAPARNPGMWQPALFETMARLSHGQTTFGTFTAAGFVRRGLKQVGFAVQKIPGFGGKRDISCGQMVHPRQDRRLAPWFAPAPAISPPRDALVVGAGLAGATTAYALAQSGVTVTVLDAKAAPAQAASGNLAGTLHPLITADWNRRSQFYTLGLAATRRWLMPWLAAADSGVQGRLDGGVQLAVKAALKERFEKARFRIPLPESLACLQEAGRISATLGSATDCDGVWFSQAGWVSPPSVVARCLSHPNIKVVCQAPVSDWGNINQAWWVETEQGRFQADHLILATGALDAGVSERLRCPIRPVKGQVTHLSAAALDKRLSVPVNHQGYSIEAHWPQAPEVAAVCGATFEGDDPDETLTEASHRHNLAAAASALPNWLHWQASSMTRPEGVSGRVAWRPTTADHLPVVGPVPDWEGLARLYEGRPPGKRPRFYPDMPYQPGLWVNNGHGARGLMSVFLSADLLVAQMMQRPWPVPAPVAHWVHPARFAVRAWQKGHYDFNP
ncbi:bifunctional tRNA (5-methylaminomethyl-2-thiouridine)(34)-methyltransferase MnmD/FAD-dependent 5-carboxymethylaminomethyl-2-thiouridine(34) oxidoreductase MnmC [Thiomicrospira sp. WB1]|uniref:bifunctional tRNA (5-methylaminomethyl-2-thiouridine)(34)-methyltransferase MnmD/FAD-dependent 5-carboxymethylaminomethyl-2-thiouridine(34) oxidoreductase MnmC n=1 Tax=Thiomicrospira sp. WB1 TaxID=1685380 RepID=UPI000748C983|nr:bifunctional tRNA (5-methylaminomethyl-2-thiouridine)(34)-methyltransferase MnmD/FAD-dependent 5-carboxymethylaminomethyl-2-thiouridine(34) oxidoreductase MnmC [Thiomicrospira sp. WB1]KUJ71247.1 hypothetical protein AVO41_10360 [Thiomicrospira sp. WB1]